MNSLLRVMLIDWKGATRSAIWHRKLIVNALLVLTFLYLLGNLLFLGIVLDDILIAIDVEGIDYNTFRESFVVRRLHRYLLYYFFADFLLRYFMQKLPALTLQPYLHLPISRRSLVHFLLLKSLASPFNLLHLVLFAPFVMELFGNLPVSQALPWTVAMLCLVLTANYTLLFLKRSSETDSRVYGGLLIALAALVALHWFDVIDFNQVSSRIFDPMFLHPFAWLIPFATAMGMYLINYRYLRSNMYMSRISRGKRDEVHYAGDGVLSGFGLVGRLVEMEFKFIWRNKRPKSVLLITLLFLGYGLLIFTQPEFKENYMMYILFSIIITGMFIMNYGQYLLGWEGSHFDHILTRNVRFYDYYMGKFLMFAMVSAAAMILSIPYVYFGWEVLLVLFCVFLFNVGVNTHLVMFFGSLNPKKIDLSKGTVFNWQGVGAAQFLLIFPVMGLPMLIYGIGFLLWGTTGGVLLIGAVGLLGLALTKFAIQGLALWLQRQRHKISMDFKNQ